jgi:TolB-like protein
MNSDRLDSWKEISGYLKRDIRTCIRWKNLYSLPVHKIDEKSPYSRVFAYKSEIDKWLKEKSNNKLKESLLTNKWIYGILASVLILSLVIYILLNPSQNSLQSTSNLPTLVVFPIENLEASQNIDYMCEGITNEIVNKLILINDLKVIPLDHHKTNKDVSRNLKQLHRSLGAEYLLRGKTIRHDENVGISLELIKVKDNSKIWEKEFNNTEKNILHVIENTYLKITELLNDSSSDQPFLGNYTENNSFINYLKGEYILNKIKSGDNDPWELYLKGKYLSGRCSLESNDIAINFFNQAIEIDKNFALPYIGLAQCYTNYVNFAWDFNKKWLDKAESLLNKAKSLSFHGPEYYSTSLMTYLIKLVGFGEGNPNNIDRLAEEGIKKYNLAPQLNSIVGYWYFLKFGESGKISYFKKALEYKERSFLLNSSSINNMVYAELLMLNKEFNKALDVCRNTERNNPSSLTKFRLGEIYYYMGDLNKSNFIFNQFENSDLRLKIDSLFFRAMISSRLGEKNDVQKKIKRIKLLSPENTTNEDDLKLASIYFGLNMKSQGYQNLTKHFNNLTSKYNYFIDWKYTEIDKNFDSVRNESKYKNIFKRKQ